MLAPIWGKLVDVQAECAERVIRNTECTQESFHFCFLSSCKHVYPTQMDMVKGKETKWPEDKQWLGHSIKKKI